MTAIKLLQTARILTQGSLTDALSQRQFTIRVASFWPPTWTRVPEP